MEAVRHRCPIVRLLSVCRDAWQISYQCDHYNNEYRVCEASRELMSRRLGYFRMETRKLLSIFFNLITLWNNRLHQNLSHQCFMPKDAIMFAIVWDPWNEICYWQVCWLCNIISPIDRILFLSVVSDLNNRTRSIITSRPDPQQAE